jgi:type I restriction enzyme R subunit
LAIPADEYRREMIQRVLREAHDLDEFRQLWIESRRRRKLIDHLLGDNFSPELIREIDQMTDTTTMTSSPTTATTRLPQAPGAQIVYLKNNQAWFESIDPKATTLLRGLS